MERGDAILTGMNLDHAEVGIGAGSNGERGSDPTRFGIPVHVGRPQYELADSLGVDRKTIRKYPIVAN
jgi:hypothetical protein